MKLKSLDHHPELKDRFCLLANSLSSGSNGSLVINSEVVLSILNTKFNIPTEAFFFEDDSGEYCGRILLQGAALDEEVGHFGLFCLSERPKHQQDFLLLWPEIEDWFKYYGMKKIVGPYLLNQNTDSHYLTATDSEIFKKLNFLPHEAHRLIKILE